MVFRWLAPVALLMGAIALGVPPSQNACLNFDLLLRSRFLTLNRDGSVGVRASEVAEYFAQTFGAQPTAIYLVGSHAERAATGESDIDIYIQFSPATAQAHPRLLSDGKFEGPGFEFFRSINPGRIPPGMVGLGIGPGRGMLGTDIPKYGTIDPFFGTGPPRSDEVVPVRLWP